MKKLRFLSRLSAVVLVAVFAFAGSGCKKDKADYNPPFLEVAEDPVTFTAEGGDVVLDIRTNRDLTIKITEPTNPDWITANAVFGKGGEGKLTISTLANESVERTAKIELRASTKIITLNVTQYGEGGGETIYYETFGTPSGNTNVDAYNGWDKTGTGAANVTYVGGGVSIRTSGNSAGTYPGASGGGSAYFGGVNPTDPTAPYASRFLDIKDITLPATATNLYLTFGISCLDGNNPATPITPSMMKVQGSVDGGSTWTDITFTNSDTAGWVLASSQFKVNAGTTNLWLRYTSYSYNMRIDDVKLAEGGNGSDGEIGGGGAPPTPVNAIYLETFGTPATATFVDAYTGWATSGTGASTVTYFGNGASLRVTRPSAGYNGASGSGCVFFGGVIPAGMFEVQAITLPATATNLKLTFGISNSTTGLVDAPVTATDMTLQGSLDGTNWTNLTFTNDATASWVLATSEFKVPAATAKLWLRYTANVINMRIDDIQLVEGGSGTVEVGTNTSTGVATYYRPVFSSTALKQGTPIENGKLTIAYTNVISQSATVTVTADVAGGGASGITAGPFTGAINGSGYIVIPVTGTPTASGLVTFTVDILGYGDWDDITATVDTADPTGYFSATWSSQTVTNGGESPWAATSVENLTDITMGGLTKEGTWTLPSQVAGNAWGGIGNWNTTTPNANYLALTITANPKISFLNIIMGMRASNTGPKKVQLTYSIDSGADVPIADLTSLATSSKKFTIDLSTVTALQNITSGATITFKIFPYDGSGATGTWYLQNGGSDPNAWSAFMIEGTKTVAP